MLEKIEIARGAEAIIIKKNENILIKKIIKKDYRIKEIDIRLRKFRTKREFKLLKKCYALKINVPKVRELKQFSFEMEYLKGKTIDEIIKNNNLNEIKEVFSRIGKQIDIMHKNDIIHGDLTTSNMILLRNKIFFFDFSLGEVTNKIEKKAVDLHLLKQSLVAKYNSVWKICFDEIIKNYEDNVVLNKLVSVEKRGRKKQ